MGSPLREMASDPGWVARQMNRGKEKHSQRERWKVRIVDTFLEYVSVLCRLIEKWEKVDSK